MSTGNDIGDVIALPGDPTLDFDAEDLRIESVVLLEREFYITYAGGHGSFIPEGSTEMEYSLDEIKGEIQMLLPSDDPSAIELYKNRLNHWQENQTPLRLTAAPGKQSALIEDKIVWLPIPRRPFLMSPDS